MTCPSCLRPRSTCMAGELHEPRYSAADSELVIGPHRVAVVRTPHEIEIELTTEQERLLVGWALDCSAPTDAVVERLLPRVLDQWRGEVERADDVYWRAA